MAANEFAPICAEDTRQTVFLPFKPPWHRINMVVVWSLFIRFMFRQFLCNRSPFISNAICGKAHREKTPVLRSSSVGAAIGCPLTIYTSGIAHRKPGHLAVAASHSGTRFGCRI